MNSQDARSAIVGLNASLKRAGLDWVVQEVSRVVERGIEERKEVAFESFDAADEPIKKRGRRTEVTITRPLTEMEELRVLVASVRASVIDVNETQEKALLGLKTKDMENPSIGFRPDIPDGFEDKGYALTDERGRPFDLSLAEVERQKQRISKLKTIIMQLEEMIRAD
ncbi:MAG: hypothetical protein C5B50_02645 [Verrucomicrobia bacterium]|nr:MAG: hypothetical protein C5B50_02645 [Verrucomicrobiota bacterium]